MHAWASRVFRGTNRPRLGRPDRGVNGGGADSSRAGDGLPRRPAERSGTGTAARTKAVRVRCFPGESPEPARTRRPVDAPLTAAPGGPTLQRGILVNG
nr:hypothetical protein StreXyl84_08240 [Streptomyces sp. Xyl84]